MNQNHYPVFLVITEAHLNSTIAEKYKLIETCNKINTEKEKVKFNAELNYLFFKEAVMRSVLRNMKENKIPVGTPVDVSRYYDWFREDCSNIVNIKIIKRDDLDTEKKQRMSKAQKRERK